MSTVPDDLDTISFASSEQLWAWLDSHHATHPGVWVQMQKATSLVACVSFNDLLEAGIAYGWSESSRRGFDAGSYLQKFTPRRALGTTSDRNLRIAERLESEGRMTPAGRQALGR